MFIFKYGKYFFMLLIFTACVSPGAHIENIYEETFSDRKDIICPKVRYIENLDKLKVKDGDEEIYTINFYETKWQCYSYFINNKNSSYNIDLDIKFKIDYNKNINIYKQEEFSFIVVLIDSDKNIIVKDKFERNFKNISNSQILAQNNLININYRQTEKNLGHYQLLIGFIK